MSGDVEEAAASAIVFVAAGLVFMAAMGTLVYFANSKVPPASEERASVDYHARARYLMETYVWAIDGDGYAPSAGVPSGPLDDPPCGSLAGPGYGDWPETAPPKLGYPAGPIGLVDQRKVRTLAEAAAASYACKDPETGDGTYHYEQLRAAWGLTTVDLDFRLVIERTDDPAADPLLEYGLDVPAGSATTPAVSHLPLRPVAGGADIPVRVTIHVF